MQLFKIEYLSKFKVTKAWKGKSVAIFVTYKRPIVTERDFFLNK